MIEDLHARRAAFGLHQLFHFAIVAAANLVLVEEIGDLGVVAHEAEAMAVERKSAGLVASVVERDAMRIGVPPLRTRSSQDRPE